MKQQIFLAYAFSLGFLALTIAPVVAQELDPALIERGKAVYNGAGACAACHGALGKGDGPAAAALPVKPTDFSKGEFKFDTVSDGKKGTKEDIFKMITDGAAAYGGSPMMVGRADLPEEDRKAMAVFILSLAE